MGSFLNLILYCFVKRSDTFFMNKKSERLIDYLTKWWINKYTVAASPLPPQRPKILYVPNAKFLQFYRPLLNGNMAKITYISMINTIQ